jgi:uncharacterized repeat protein (TIGR01451 family)/CSLREA domain-containing protein
MLSASSFGSGVHRGRWLVLSTVTTACLFGSAAMADAATFTVNSTTDAALSSPSSTSCPSTCTLREAVQAADNTGGANTITLPAGDFKLTLADTASGQTDNPTVGDLDVNSGVSLTVTGAGSASTTIDANHIDRAFAVHGGGSLSVSGVTVERGVQPGSSPSDDSILPGYGGAFYNDGTLSISGSVLTDDSAEYGGVVVADTGATSTSIANSTVTGDSVDDYGGVAYIASGSVTLSGDTVTHNSAESEAGVVYDYESSGTVGALTISGSTLSNNSADSDGGALYVDDAGALNITNSTINSSSTDDEDGGAIYDSQSGAVTINGSTISSNTSGDEDGGALYADDTGATTISGSTFDNDSAGDEEGGGVYVDDGTLALSGSTFQGDSGDEGGAVYVGGSSATSLSTITTSSFIGNLAGDDEGGAIYDDFGALNVSRSTFANNNAGYEGGAFYYDSGDALALTNDTFDGNQSYEGGAIYFDTTASTGTITLLNDTIARNTGYEGGGIYYPQDANTIENTIVAENNGGFTADGGGDCYGTAATDNATSKDIGGNLDSDGTCFSASVTGDHINVNPDLGTLSANGSQMQTDALLTGSPAIGTAIQSACPVTDERGVTRPTACDSGAYQTAVAALSITSTGPASATISTPITYTLTVTNNGPGAALGVGVSDTLPANTTYFGSTSSQGSCVGTTTITCSLGTIDSTQTGTSHTATITITVIPTAAGSLSNSATVASTNGSAASVTSGAAATTVSPVATAAGAPAAGAPAAGATVTKFVKPVTATGVASKIRTTRAYLSALVNPAGQATTYTIQVQLKGTSRWISGKARTLAAQVRVDKVAMTISHLKSGKRYSFRVKASSSIGTSYGQVRRFRTNVKTTTTK